MPVIDEPVRGRIPPPWFWAMSGLERMQALTNGFVSLPPFYRLTGLRPAHVTPGSCTYTRPASPWLAGGPGDLLDMGTLPEIALRSAATTAVGPGQRVDLVNIVYNYMRPARPEPGNCLARGTVRSASRFFIFADGEVVDPSGREIVACTAQYRIAEVEPPPPSPPSRLEPITEPTYDLPDPVERPLNENVTRGGPFQVRAGADVRELFSSGRAQGALNELFGTSQRRWEHGEVESYFPASEWFCCWQPVVTEAVFAFALTGALWTAGWSDAGPDETHAELQQNIYVHRTVPADGRYFRVSGEVVASTEDRVTTRGRLLSADDVLIAEGTSVGMKIPKELRVKRTTVDVVRTLATLVFSDIVGSTEHLARLGDAEWGKLKDQHHNAVRQQIAMYRGTEVDTAGDGFFVRFESPAQALNYARAIRSAASHLGLQLRIGMHTGECEVQGREVTGMAVHVAARLEGAAEPGEIIVSEVVKTLVMGSSHTFTERGERELKGVPGTWRVFALAN